MKLGMSFEESGLFKAFVAAFEIANKCLGRSRCSRRGHDGRHAAVAGRGDAFDDGDMLAGSGAEDVSAGTGSGNDGSSGLSGIDQSLNKGGIGAQHGTGRSGVEVGHGSHLALALVLGLFLERQRLCTGKHLTDGYGQRLTGRRA